MAPKVLDVSQLPVEVLPDPHIVLDETGALLGANALFDRRLLGQPGVLQCLAVCENSPHEIAADIGGERRVYQASWSRCTWKGMPARLVRLLDVTEERLITDVAERNLQMLEDAVDALPVSMLIVDDRGIIRSGNVRWHVTAQARGLTLPASGVGSSYLAVCDRAAAEGDDDAARAAAGLRDVLARRALAYEQEYTMPVGGEPHWFRLSVNALSGEPGAVIQHADTTAAHLARQALLDALAHFKAVFNGALDGILIFADDMRVLDANPAARLFMGSSMSADLLVRLPDMVVPEDLDSLREQHEDLLAHGSARGRLRLRRSDGGAAEVEYASRANVVPGRHVAVLRDLSASRQLEAQLRQAQKMEAIGQLTGGIAHDFNNILTVVVAHAELLLADQHASEDTRDSVLEMLRASQRGADMVRKLMAFGRREQLKVQPTDVNAVMKDVGSILRRLLPETILVQCHAQDNVPPVMADATAVQQILLNLATNARDAMRDHGGEFRLALSTASGDALGHDRGRQDVRSIRHVVLSAIDTGTGMSDETVSRLFEPFFTTKPVGEGTGLGMSMVYGLMKQMGGHVTVESRLGNGTSIHLHFPITVAPSPEVPATARTMPESAPEGRERILLVEDDDAIRALSARVLRRAGYEVVEAMNGNHATECLRQRGGAHDDKFDLVISDVVMPHGDGATVLESVRRYAKGVRLVWVTGYAGGFTDGDVHAPCDAPIIQKPWTTSDLLARVRAVLDGPPNVPLDSPVTHDQHRAG